MADIELKVKQAIAMQKDAPFDKPMCGECPATNAKECYRIIFRSACLNRSESWNQIRRNNGDQEPTSEEHKET